MEGQYEEKKAMILADRPGEGKNKWISRTGYNVMVWGLGQLSWFTPKMHEMIENMQHSGFHMNRDKDKSRLEDWGYDIGTVTPTDLEHTVTIITGWIQVTDPEAVPHNILGITLGQEFVLMLAQSSCCSLPQYTVEKRAVLANALVNIKAGGYACAICYDVHKILQLGQGCCGNPACTDIVNVDVIPCPCTEHASDESE